MPVAAKRAPKTIMGQLDVDNFLSPLADRLIEMQLNGKRPRNRQTEGVLTS